MTFAAKPHIWRVRVAGQPMWVCGYRLPLNGRSSSLGLGETPLQAWQSFKRGSTTPGYYPGLSMAEFFKRWAP